MSLKRNEVFDLLGAVPTNGRWSWSALSPDHKRAVFTVWEDEISNGSNRLLWDDYNTSSRLGDRDQRKNLELVMKNKIPAYGLVCVAVDPSVSPRSIKQVKSDYLIELEIYQDASGVHCKHLKKVVLAKMVKNVARLGKTHSNGLYDLGNPPDGFEMPDRALTVGWTVIRDPKVRSFVINQANGRCEYCGTEGFLMSNGERYIEAHHIIALSAAGADTIFNVIALCPHHHRQAHYGENAVALELEFLSKIQNRPSI